MKPRFGVTRRIPYVELTPGRCTGCNAFVIATPDPLGVKREVLKPAFEKHLRERHKANPWGDPPNLEGEDWLEIIDIDKES